MRFSNNPKLKPDSPFTVCEGSSFTLHACIMLVALFGSKKVSFFFVFFFWNFTRANKRMNLIFWNKPDKSWHLCISDRQKDICQKTAPKLPKSIIKWTKNSFLELKKYCSGSVSRLMWPNESKLLLNDLSSRGRCSLKVNELN